jgi:hypothetical protein
MKILFIGFLGLVFMCFYWLPSKSLTSSNQKDFKPTDGLVSLDNLFQENWHLLPQPIFWKDIMFLSPDSCLINIAKNRQVLLRMSIHEWNKQSETAKLQFKDSLRKSYSLDQTEKINVTTGKNDFYKFNVVYPTIPRGVEVFRENNVDPWYAQVILMIESPGQLKKSISGAYGAFQLMPGVARNHGLTVNEKIDEREDFDKSAKAASHLIATVCIPEAKKILNTHHITYSEEDLWFRLFVLHVYHAGAINVRAVVNKIAPENGGQQLICTMWQTQAGNFGNNSQNYTQLALASQLVLSDLIAANEKK